MRKFAKIAAAAAVALPLIGIAGASSAQAADRVTFGVTVGTYDPYTVRYDRGYYTNGYYYNRAALPPQVMAGYLRTNFYNVRNLDRRGDVYVAAAADRYGRHVRVTANAYTGQVIDIDVLGESKWEKRMDRRDNHDGVDWDGDGRDRDRINYYRR